ncbi:hypothetical protein [Nocardia sp. NPDC049707]|uniref:hypothetical protein n=1 Tax=Nocardia sp. NPDC049707 TaxID=3154735 RepID=UPI0034283C94
MSKLRVFAAAIAAAGIVATGSSLASAAAIPLDTPQAQDIIAPGEPDPSGGTGSSKAIVDLTKILTTGSSQRGNAG